MADVSGADATSVDDKEVPGAQGDVPEETIVQSMDCSCPQDNSEATSRTNDKLEESTAVETVGDVVEETVAASSSGKEDIVFKVIFNKQKYDVTFNFDALVSDLKQHIEGLTGVPTSLQKLMFRGKMTDSQTLRQHNMTPGSKVMLIGSTMEELLKVTTTPTSAQLKEEKLKEQSAKEPLCQQKPHKTILDKHGKPDDVMPGIKNTRHPLPHTPIAGMYNKSGGKVRLTFKLESDELWIGTKERTDKIPLHSIKAVVSEALKGHEEYHMLALQLGPTEASRYWVYWVPAQYVEAIKDTILGKWQV